MSGANGRLPASRLAPIRGGHLERHAAAAWNAMCREAHARYGVWLRPLGHMSSYRTYVMQVYLWHLYLTGRGNLAARPGTSNHGWGLAVDLASRRMRWIVDQIGRKYGFSKSCSDAPSEWWHVKYNPHCTHATWRPSPRLPTVRAGAKGPVVKKLTLLLHNRLGFKSVPRTNFYGRSARSAVRRFQRKHGLHADGVVGPSTWRALVRAAS